MELQRMKLENIKQRIMNGESVKSAEIKNGEFAVQLTNGPEITFEDNYKETVESTIRKARNGERDSI
jgi:hypothetical protein